MSGDYANLPDGLPVPQDDGAAAHLPRTILPPVSLPATDGTLVDLGGLDGLVVIYCYPMTGRPGVDLPDGWDAIPGARGCTPQACAFRDSAAELAALGVTHVFGVSTQTTAEQREAAERLHLPYPLLSDRAGELGEALRLPTMTVDGRIMLKRLTMVVCDGVVETVFYPVYPPDRSADEVIDHLRTR